MGLSIAQLRRINPGEETKHLPIASVKQNMLRCVEWCEHEGGSAGQARRSRGEPLSSHRSGEPL